MKSPKCNGFQYSVLIRKWIKFNRNVTLVNRIRAFEGVDTMLIHFKKHNCIQDTDILIKLGETSSYIRRAESH